MSSRRQRSIPLGGRYRQVSLYLFFCFFFTTLTHYWIDDSFADNQASSIISNFNDDQHHFIFQGWIHNNAIRFFILHCSDVTVSLMGSQSTGISTACSSVCSCSHQRKQQSSVSLAFVRGIHRSPVDSPHKGLVFPFDDFIMWIQFRQHHPNIFNRN